MKKLVWNILLAAIVLLGGRGQTLAALQGVDVYSGQGTINWASAKNAGMRFAFVKATEGVDFVDSKFTTNMNAAIAAGIPVGPYHFARTNSNESTVQDPTPNPDAVAEANDFCDAIQSYYSGPGLVLRPVLDMEQLPDGPIAPFTNKTYISKWSKDFSNVVKTRIGVTPIIYLNGNFAINYMDSSFSTYPLWFAKPITPTPSDPSDSAFQNNINNVSPPTDAQMGIWSSYAFWQWSWEGAVSGISGDVDRDYFPGTMQQLAEQYVVGWLPGDFNGDNTVDGLDYIRWRDTLGQTVNFGLGADGDLSGVIDIADYNIWKAHFGSGSGAGSGGMTAAVGVPEPCTLLLTLIVAAMLAAKRYVLLYAAPCRFVMRMSWMDRSHRIAILWITAVSAFGVASAAHAVYVQGIDISHYQGDITAGEWEQVKGAGIRFAFVKVTDGACCDVDSAYVTNLNRAIAAGMPVGPYHFAYPETGTSNPNDAYNEADHFVMRVQSYYQGTGLMLRPVLDFETIPPSDQYVGSTTASKKAFVSEWIRKWVSRVKSSLGVDPIIYTGGSIAQNYFDQDISQNTLWFAKPITPTPSDPNDSAYQNNINNISPPTDAQMGVWSSYAFWQWSWEGAIPGISGNVDRDVYNGTIQDMAANYIVGFLPGDFNGDNKVDALDYVKWRDTNGQTVGYGIGADGDLSGTVDAADYNVWLSHFGSSGSGAGGGGVGAPSGAPEPATLLLVLISAAMLAARRCWMPRRAALA